MSYEEEVCRQMRCQFYIKITLCEMYTCIDMYASVRRMDR